MGRIVTLVSITNATNPDYFLRCDALVDTGASYMFLPTAWKERLGDLNLIRTVELQTSTQSSVNGEVYGPVQIKIDGFSPIYSEVVFVEMQPEDGFYEPLIGYIILEQSQIAVDMVGHRLMPVKKMDFR
jgi:predicted aspartyl protease